MNQVNAYWGCAWFSYCLIRRSTRRISVAICTGVVNSNVVSFIIHDSQMEVNRFLQNSASYEKLLFSLRSKFIFVTFSDVVRI
jgi:hypothetical protein